MIYDHREVNQDIELLDEGFDEEFYEILEDLPIKHWLRFILENKDL